MKRTVLVIPDSGPLISLGIANQLDLLLRLEMPIYLVDQVLYECTKDPTKIGATTILEWVTHAHIVVVETFVGRAAKQARETGVNPNSRGLGEAAIAELFATLDDKIAPEDPVLILFEDSDVRRISILIQGNAHLLSTRALLLGMEECGVISSAEAVWQTIIAAGRIPSLKLIDQSSPLVRSYWQPSPPHSTAWPSQAK